ncbi:MAG: exopolysaccharide biosynthesis polyprenyl glycosylphosphotransferase [Candidatus Aminicenantes bacterium]|nr:exopolysaccharide biosynthesis polyprenyl glycosylphosphotransferase [Candidatus Aminicenantes bacterium]
MLKEKSKIVIQAHKFLDIFITALAFIGAYFIKKHILPEPFQGLTQSPNYYIVLLMIIIIWYICFDFFSLYNSYRKQTLGKILWNIIKAVSIGMLIMFLCMFILKIEDVSRIMIGIFYVLNVTLLVICKTFAYKILTYYRQKGYNFRNILIIGSRERAKDVIGAMGERLGSGYRIIGCLETDESQLGKEVMTDIKVIGTVEHLGKILLKQTVDELIFAMPLKKIQNSEEYIAFAEKMGISVRIIPDWQIHKLMYSPRIASIRFEQFMGLPTMALITTPPNQGELFLKSIFDYSFAIIVLILLLPLFLIISIAIKISSKGPILFKQERCGLNGRRFKIYKFRTMFTGAEALRQEMEALNESDGPAFKIKNDPRIIPYVGTFLRKTSLDELPQLINILKGEMSMVGPRPPIPDEVEKYDVWQRRRLSMKPGLTCLWQITPGRNVVSFNKWMEMDLEYIDNWSLGLDYKIFLGTAKVIFMGAGR